MRPTDRRGGTGTIALLGLLLATAGMAGCIGDDGEGLEATGLLGGGEEVVEVPYDQQGSLDLAAGLCSDGASVGANPCNGGSELSQAGPPGTVTGAELTLTWEAQSPTMEEMGITLAWGCDDDGSCQTDWARGTSPVDLAVDGFEEPGKVYLLVWHPGTGTEEAFVRHTLPQDFEITGTFTTIGGTR